MRKLIRWLTAFLVALALTACEGGGTIIALEEEQESTEPHPLEGSYELVSVNGYKVPARIEYHVRDTELAIYSGSLTLAPTSYRQLSRIELIYIPTNTVVHLDTLDTRGSWEVVGERLMLFNTRGSLVGEGGLTQGNLEVRRFSDWSLWVYQR